MTMHSVLLKEHEGIIPNPNDHISGSVHWWSGLRSPLRGGELGLGKGSTPQFTIFPEIICVLTSPVGLDLTSPVVSHSGNLKASDKDEKSSKLFETFSKQSSSPEHQGRIELGYGQSLICGKYAYPDPSYGLFSPYGSQLTGRIMLPLDLTTDEGPVYVNAKQYHGIIRRRISRAKAEAVNKALKFRKPYLHQSRHLHAMRRPRGCGGRFLNTKNLDCRKTGKETGKTRSGHFSLSIDSQNSEVVQSDSGHLSCPNEANGRKSNLSGTEVTSIFSTANVGHFSSNHLRSFTPFSEMMNTGHGLAMSGNWV